MKILGQIYIVAKEAGPGNTKRASTAILWLDTLEVRSRRRVDAISAIT